MADRKVERTGKDPDGDITKLCGGGIWSPRMKADAIRDIDLNLHTYYVQTGIYRTNIHVVNGPTGKYLRTDPDTTNSNNLDDLPDC
jgi:hypothetical protein